jgi:hypothetical protein
MGRMQTRGPSRGTVHYQIRKFARPRVGLAGDGTGTRRLPSLVAQAQLHSPKEERLIIADPQAGLDKLLKKKPS